MGAKLSQPQRAALDLLSGGPRVPAARTFGRFISAASAKALIRRGLAETFLPPDGIRKVRITDEGRARLIEGGR